MNALLIDHDDSFTQNLKHWLLQLFKEIVLINHTEIAELQKKQKSYDLIVLSPGPKHPQDYLSTINFLKTLPNSQAVFGVCLGLQMMALACNEKVLPYSPPQHGKTSELSLLTTALSHFSNLKVARYHSLKVELQSALHFEILAHSQDDFHPMWLQHKKNKWMGVQFHPESFLTEKPELHLQALQRWMQS
jgi:anthranilate synthase/aminodeoxychorismate synthase-like glutamine amidotransferase